MIRERANNMNHKRTHYSTEFKEQALHKVRNRGDATLHSVALDLNITLPTLKGWLQQRQRLEEQLPHGATALPNALPAAAWSAPQRLQALMESHPLQGEALAAWCRERGIFEHHLATWRLGFSKPGKLADEAGGARDVRDVRESRTQLRASQQHIEQLKRELRRKESALAEAAALLVLQKKFQALWADEA
jgi:transposase-like protein